MEQNQKDGPDPTQGTSPDSGDDRRDWTTPKLISEDVTGVTRGGVGINAPPDRGTMYSS